MKRIIALTSFAAVCLGTTPVRADALDRKIQKLEREARTLEYNFWRALKFRAKYMTLKAEIYFLDRLLKQDRKMLKYAGKLANQPVTLIELFLSDQRGSYASASRRRNVYSPGQTYLWFRCRFGLATVRARRLYTIRVEIVDATYGTRIYQSFGPYQRRASSVYETFFLGLKSLRVARGRYKIRASVEADGNTARQVIPFTYGGTPRYRYRTPAPRYRAPADPNKMGTF